VVIAVAIMAGVRFPSTAAAQLIPPDTVTTLETDEALGSFGRLGGVTRGDQSDLYVNETSETALAS